LDVDGDWKDTERTCRVSQAVSATMEFDFEGTGVCILGRRSSNCGQAEISLDDGKGEVIPLHQAVELSRMPLFRTDDLEPGKHKVRLTVLGPSDPSQKDAFVYLDGILVEKPSPLAVATTDPGDEEAMALEMDPEPETAKPAKKPKTSKTITKAPTAKAEKTPAK